MNDLGTFIKEKRQKLGLTQSELADGICTQPMISAIEAQKYIPNSQILMAICKKLQIKLDDLYLDENYQISRFDKLNKQIILLCNNHQYQQLKEFLLLPATIHAVETERETQAYHYYLGVSYVQADDDHFNAKLNFKLALSTTNRHSKLSTLDRLAAISMSAILAQDQLKLESEHYLKLAFQKFSTAKYETNQIALFYLAAYSARLLDHDAEAITWLIHGIEFATSHDSHYMLGNMYYLLAQLVSDSKSTQVGTYETRSKIFADLFNEKIFKTDD